MSCGRAERKESPITLSFRKINPGFFHAVAMTLNRQIADATLCNLSTRFSANNVEIISSAYWAYSICGRNLQNFLNAQKFNLCILIYFLVPPKGVVNHRKRWHKVNGRHFGHSY